jgi:DeoR family transcriptional regulator, suf operon transcriptional repressor
MLRRQLLGSSRGRICALLQRDDLTVEDIASRLGLTANAVRAQITAMERDGIVQRVGQRPGSTRPSQVFGLTSEVELLLSRAYVPVLRQLVRVFSAKLPAQQFNALMREAGTELANELPIKRRPSRTLRTRVFQASELLNEQLGAITQVTENGGYVIRGFGCPLAALSGNHPAICMAIESLIQQMVGVPVRECCDRTARPRCCFEIKPGKTTGRSSKQASGSWSQGRRSESPG